MISRFFDGLTGGNITVAQAYISDVTDEKSRSKGMGMIGAAFGLGFILGPASGGFLSQWGYAVPAFVSAGLSLMNLFLIFFLLPESLPKEKRVLHLSEAKRKHPLSGLATAYAKPIAGPILSSARSFVGSTRKRSWRNDEPGHSASGSPSGTDSIAKEKRVKDEGKPGAGRFANSRVP